MDLQALINTMSEVSQRERSGYHLTLGGLIDGLKALPADLPVIFSHDGTSPADPCSYRGYYHDLAFASADEPRSVGDVLSEASNALGKVFEGYKGGDYLMTERTPLWASEYGMASGWAVLGLSVKDNKAVLETRLVD